MEDINKSKEALEKFDESQREKFREQLMELTTDSHGKFNIEKFNENKQKIFDIMSMAILGRCSSKAWQDYNKSELEREYGKFATIEDDEGVTCDKEEKQ